jgi:FtsP/CotA-like multicopper oxidase with cupredoxin domain
MRLLRRVLILAVAVALLAAVGVAVAFAAVWSRAATSTAGEVAFADPLAIPPLAESRVDAQGRRVFDLTAGEGSHDFGRGRSTPTWGFNGDYLGPTLRAQRGEQVVVNVRNELAESTTVHWHGMHLPAAMDGGPHQPIAPGDTWSPTWRIDQPAATLWYHPHPHGDTEEHVYRGLAGMFILDDEAAPVDLPEEYGVDDIPVIVQDKRFTDDGRLNESGPLGSDIGVLGDTIAVNGTVAPYLDVTTERLRLRLLNASTARTYDFGFADDRQFALVGTDGGLLATPYPTSRVMLSPGERAEIVVTVRPGEEAVLRSTPPPLGLDAINRRMSGGDDTLDILQLRAADELAPSPEMPHRLVEVPRLDPAEAAQTRTFRLSGRNINGQRMDMDRIDATVLTDSVEIWEVTNAQNATHNFHVHDVQFQVLTVDGGPPPPELAGWKDTIYLPPDVRFELILRFADYADPGAPYMFHCHILYHEDRGMMGQFVVVKPGQEAGTPGRTHDHDQGSGTASAPNAVSPLSRVADGERGALGRRVSRMTVRTGRPWVSLGHPRPHVVAGNT